MALVVDPSSRADPGQGEDPGNTSAAADGRKLSWHFVPEGPCPDPRVRRARPAASAAAGRSTAARERRVQQKLVGAAHQIGHERHTSELRQLGGAVLHDRARGAVGEPSRSRRRQRAVEHTRIAVELAALHGDQRVVLPGIAGNDFHFRAERGVEQARHSQNAPRIPMEGRIA